MLKLKYCFLIVLFVLSSVGFSASAASDQNLTYTRTTIPGSCEIEIFNFGNFLLRVNGSLDDGHILDPFYMSAYDRRPYYIPLVVSGYCYGGMNLYIDTVFGNISLFNGYVARNTCIRLFYSSMKQKFNVNMTSR